MGVVLFHFGAWWLPGGFAGVDVFFVISGYVISSSIFRELDAGGFSIVEFYARRARRIVPAFFVVTAATSIASLVILYPDQLVAYAKSALAASLFAGNIYFFWTTSYFAPGGTEIPLLHYWSLGVEEQFYLFFPIAALGIFRFARRWTVAALAVLAVLSLVACEWTVHRYPAAAFYLFPFRAFELLIGCLLAATPTVPKWAQLPTALVGVSCVVGAMLLIDESVPFPGLWALVPCLGAAAVIAGGEHNPVSRMLSLRPFSFIGDISYSLYLVHWPIVTLALMVDPHLWGTPFLAVGTAASIAMGWLSYVTVEQPFRNRRWFAVRSRLFHMAGLALALTAGCALATVQLRGFPSRMKHAVARVLSYENYDYAPMFREGTCFLRPEQSAEALQPDACLPPNTDTVLWGSSAIAMLFWGLDAEYKKTGRVLGQLTASGCTILPGVDNSARPNCRYFIDATLRLILERRPRVVIIGGDILTASDHLILSRDLIARLAEAGIKTVVLGPVPVFSKPVPQLIADRMRAGRHDFQSGDDLVKSRVAADAIEEDFFSNAAYISVIAAGCPDGQCPLALDAIPLHFDSFHATREGSAYYASRLIDRLP